MTAVSDETGREALQSPQHIIEGIILRRLHDERIEGYTLEMSKEIAAALSAAPVAQEPVAWVEFTEAGLIRFWTSDPARAEAERTRRSLTKFTLSELIALVGRPRTPPATPAGVGAEIAAVFDGWLERYEHGPPIQFTTAREYAADAVRDCRDAILALLSRGSGSDQQRRHEEQSTQNI